MRVRLNLLPRFSLSASSLVFLFAAFNGLAYYALILLLTPLGGIEKGYVRIVADSVFFISALVLYLKSGYKPAKYLKRPLPFPLKLLLLFLGMTGISLIWANSNGSMLEGYNLKLYYGAQLSLLLIELATILLLCKIMPISRLTYTFLRGLSLGGFLLAVTSIVFWFFGEKGYGLWSIATIIHPNLISQKMNICFLATLYLFFTYPNENNGAKKTLLFSIPMLLALVLATSKTSLFALTVGFALLMYAYPRQKHKKALVITVFIAGLILASPYISNRLATYIDREAYLTLTGRTEIWETAWQMIQKKPVLGHGLGTPVPAVSFTPDQIGYTGQAHNLYLNTLFQLGVVGLVTLLGYYFLFLVKVLQCLRINRFSALSAYALSVFGLMMVYSFTESVPVGLSIPVSLQAVLLLFLSNAWHQAMPPSTPHQSQLPSAVQELTPALSYKG